MAFKIAKKAPGWVSRILLPEISELKVEIAELKGELKSTNSRIDSLGTRIDEMDKCVSTEIRDLKESVNVMP